MLKFIDEYISLPDSLEEETPITLPKMLTAKSAAACTEWCEIYCENCMGRCQTYCEVEGYCESGCQYCERACQSCEGCQTYCQIYCEDCMGACETYCEKGGYCENCMGACETSCEQPGVCESSCENSCQSTCQKRCQDCEGSCESACQTGSSCQTGCQTGVTCQTSCQTGTTCETACQSGATCETVCQKNPCQTCQDACELACQGCQGQVVVLPDFDISEITLNTVTIGLSPGTPSYSYYRLYLYNITRDTTDYDQFLSPGAYPKTITGLTPSTNYRVNVGYTNTYQGSVTWIGSEEFSTPGIDKPYRVWIFDGHDWGEYKPIIFTGGSQGTWEEYNINLFDGGWSE